MTDVPKCTSWMGHRFVARYSEGAPAIPDKLTYHPAVDDLNHILARLRPKTYEGDICVRCGHKVMQ